MLWVGRGLTDTALGSLLLDLIRVHVPLSNACVSLDCCARQQQGLNALILLLFAGVAVRPVEVAKVSVS